MGKFFYKAYQSIAPHKWWGAIGMLVLLLSLAAIASKIKFEEDISKLIPQTSENADYQKVLKTVNFADKLIINIQRADDGTVDDLTQYASDFLDSLNTQCPGYVKNIQGTINDDDINNTLDFVYENLPLFLKGTDYEVIDQKIGRDSIRAITEENYKTLISPSGIITKKSIVKDPLGLSLLALKKLRQLNLNEGFTIKDGFVMSADERHILLFVTPTYPSNETAKNKDFANLLYRIQKNLDRAFNNKAESDYFGSVLIAVANAQQIKKDIPFTVGIALILLLFILVFFYRRWALPIILFLPTLFGALLAVSILYLIRGQISGISLGIGAVLLGVTLDYSLHILTHIRNGNSIKTLYSDVAPSILMSSLTTASAFLCLLFLHSQALQDLGVFAAASVIGASVFSLFFIPQAYKVPIKRREIKTFLDRIAAHDFHKNKWALGLLAILLTASIFTYKTVRFEKDISKLNYEPAALTESRHRIESLTDIGSKSLYVTTYGNDFEKVLQLNDSVYSKLDQLKKNGQIVNFSSAGAFLNSRTAQLNKIDQWYRFWDTPKINMVKENLIASGNQFGFKASTFDSFYAQLNTAYEPLKIDSYAHITTFAIEDYITTTDNFTTATSLVKLDSSQIETVKATFEEMPQTVLIDRQGVNETFLGNLKNDFNRLIGYSILVVLLLLFLFYRSLSLTLVTSIPIFLTWFLTLGIMGLLGLQFNIFNIIISTFIFGLGIDYSIFMTNGLLTELRTGEKALPTHKTSIILSVITTILGVGVLIFAKHPALYSISLVSLIGILSAAFIAFTVQPLLFLVFIGGRKKRPISPRYFIHSTFSFIYFGVSSLLFSLYASIVLLFSPKSRMKKQIVFHKMASKLMTSVLYSNPFVRKNIINKSGETFERPAMIIANHTSFLDSLVIRMLNPNTVFLVNDWVYNSPFFGNAAKLAGDYPVSMGLEEGEAYLGKKIAQGFSLMTFPEGTRSTTNKIKRFHKGAFHLAEQFELDVLPVLIHGISEVLPKGSFVIRDGSITIKVLDRIPAWDNRFGENSRERTKNIGAYVREEFHHLRNEIEHETYFHKSVLEDYRFKGNALFKTVSQDLRKNSSTYKKLMETISKKERIIHLSQENGQLDFLLTLDSISRKITAYIQDPDVRKVIKNSFITHKYGTIKVVDSVKEALLQSATTLIIDLESIKGKTLFDQLSDEIVILILFKIKDQTFFKEIEKHGFYRDAQNGGFTIFKKGKQGTDER